MSERYKVIRFAFSGRRRVIRRGITLAEAQMICRSPDSSSRFKTPNTKKPWFYGYERDNGGRG